METIFTIPASEKIAEDSHLSTWLKSVLVPIATFTIRDVSNDNEEITNILNIEDDITFLSVKRATEVLLKAIKDKGGVVFDDMYLFTIDDSSEHGFDISILLEDGLLYKELNILF